MEEDVEELPEMLRKAGFSKRVVEKIRIMFQATKLSREILARERGKENVKSD